MKVFWGGEQYCDSNGTLIGISEERKDPLQKEYHLLTDEELEELKKQAVRDYLDHEDQVIEKYLSNEE